VVAHVLVQGNRLIDQISHVVPRLAVVGDIDKECRRKGHLGTPRSGSETNGVYGNVPQIESDEDAGLAAELPANRTLVGPEPRVAGLPELADEMIRLIAPVHRRKSGSRKNVAVFP